MGIDEAARLVCGSIIKKERIISLTNCPKNSINSIIDRAISIEPRILGLMEYWESSYRSNGLLTNSMDYDIRVTYSDKGIPFEQVIFISQYNNSINEIISKLLLNDRVCIICFDSDKILDDFYDHFMKIKEQNEGIDNIIATQLSYDKYTIIYLEIRYVIPKNELSKARQQVNDRILNIQRLFGNILGVPNFIKVYLVFSYISQNCAFDENAEIEAIDDDENTQFPYAKISYGAICGKRASSEGIARAMKLFLDKMGIESIVVSGEFDDSKTKSSLHYWNMVKLEDGYYHLDASWNIDMKGIFVGGFMRNDFDFYNHSWRIYHPKALGEKYNYDYIEQYLVSNSSRLLELFIPEDLLYPEPVNDLA